MFAEVSKAEAALAISSCQILVRWCCRTCPKTSKHLSVNLRGFLLPISEIINGLFLRSSWNSLNLVLHNFPTQTQDFADLLQIVDPSDTDLWLTEQMQQLVLCSL